MGKVIFSFIFYKIMGWTFNSHNIKIGKKGIVVFAPHTSNWDFVIGRMCMTFLGMKPKLLVKSNLFFPPLGWLLKALGGIPVNRKKNNNLIDEVAEKIKQEESIFIVFTPEGTRSRRDKWKTGFYQTAVKANVPIYVTYGDYKKKEAGFFTVFHPTGDADKDIKAIRAMYFGVEGKYPEKGVFPVE